MTGYSYNSIIINNREVNLADILSGKVSSFSGFESSAFSFIKSWLSGESEFRMQTSGSTGAPKEILLTRFQLKQSALRTIRALELSAGDTALVCLDPHYIAGKMMLVRALEGNMKIVVIDPTSNPLQNYGEKIDFVALVPLQLQETLKNPATTQKLNQAKAVIIGGAAINELLQKQVNNLSCAVYATYGMTETVSHIALQRLNGNDSIDHFSTLPGVTIDKDERGCLSIQLPEFPEKIVTNDLVELINENKFRWIGRYDNIINSGGFKISPEKIEKSLEAITPSGVSFFVTGIHDNRLGEKLVLVMEGESKPLDLTKLNLHPYEIPKEIIFIPQFIRTETGKINRKQTKSLFSY